MLPTMDGKEISTNTPVVVIQPSQETKKMSSTKKYVIIGVISIILLGLLLTGILVGMHIFTQAQQDLVQFTLKLNDGRSQDVTSDVNNNVVKYNVKGTDQETWIVNDFNKDIKLTKILKDGISNCYLSPLNRSNAEKPSEIKKPETDIANPTGYIPVVYQVAQDPITDISFLSKDARDMCKGVSTYWLYPSCGKTSNENPMNNSTLSRNKRQPLNCFRTRYIVHYMRADPCVCGCNMEVCACKVTPECHLEGNSFKCNFFHEACPDGFYQVNNC